jgi:diguanylate cyclase (GGDEF)-like protein
MRLPGLDSIRNRIVAFALVATIIPALTTAWISYAQNKRSLNAKIAGELEAAASQSAREIDLWLKGRVYDVRVFASSYEVSENLERLVRSGSAAGHAQTRARLGEYLRSVAARFGDYPELMVLDRQGQPVSTSADTAGAVRLPDGWLDQVRTQDALLGDPYRPEVGGAQMMLAVPIADANQRFLGVFAARLAFQQLRPLLEEFAPGERGRVHLVDARGGIVVGSAGAARRSADGLTPQIWQRLAARDSAALEYDASDGTRVVGTMIGVPRLNWAMLAEIPTAEAYAQIARLGTTTALMVAALFVVVGLLAYLVGLSIVRPLNLLTHGAAQVAAGDLSVDVRVTSGGELGYLTRVFNDMVARLRGSRLELERLSVTDGLTGLSNRRRLLELLKDEVIRSRRHNRPLAVLMIDVDQFKAYNDTYGHPAGDDVLVQVASLIQSALRNGDHAARYGGEEFLVVLPETDSAAGVEAADRLRARLAQERFGPNRVEVTLSVGAASFPADGASSDELIEAADAALYRAKKNGRNRVVAAGAHTVSRTAASKRGGKR